MTSGLAAGFGLRGKLRRTPGVGPGCHARSVARTRAVYYRETRGAEPVDEFIHALPPRRAAKIDEFIEEHLNGRLPQDPPRPSRSPRRSTANCASGRHRPAASASPTRLYLPVTLAAGGSRHARYRLVERFAAHRAQEARVAERKDAVGGREPVTARGQWGRALRAAIAWNLPELSTYSPTAVHLPADVHEIPLRSAWGLVPAFEGAVTWAACSHLPLASVAFIA